MSPNRCGTCHGDLTLANLRAVRGHDPAMADLLPLLNPVVQTEIADTIATASLFGRGLEEKTQDVIIALLERPIAAPLQVALVNVDFAPGIAALIFSRAEGHPPFTNTLALSLRERGRLCPMGDGRSKPVANSLS